MCLMWFLILIIVFLNIEKITFPFYAKACSNYRHFPFTFRFGIF